MRAALNIITASSLTIAMIVPMVAVPRPAYAEDAITRTAKRYFAKGEKLFALGQFSEALEQYQLAFDAKPIPGFLFNIGQCYRNLGDLDQSIFSFRKYLTLDPNAPNKDSVQHLIDELEEKKAREDGKKLVGDSRKIGGPETGQESRPVYKKWWFWTGVVVVAAAGGATAYVLTRNGSAPSSALGDITINR
jgi:tetratricopeptide (TPR) repeat protein